MSDQILPVYPPILGPSGEYLPGARVYFYLSGTTTLADIYTSASFGTQHPNPLVADSDGRIPQVFFQGTESVKIDVHNSSDVFVFSVDPAPRATSSSVAADGVTHSPTASNSATNVQAAIASADGRINALGSQSAIGKSLFEASSKANARSIIDAATFLSIDVDSEAVVPVGGSINAILIDSSAGDFDLILPGQDVTLSATVYFIQKAENVGGSTATLLMDYLTGVFRSEGYVYRKNNKVPTTWVRVS